MNTAHDDPPYRASLHHSLCRLREQAAPRPAPTGAGTPAPFRESEMQTWIATVTNNIALYDTVTISPDAAARALRAPRFPRPGTDVPVQIMIPFRGIPVFFVRCLAALAASVPSGSHLILADTGSSDAEIARLAAYCEALKLSVLITRSPSMKALNRTTLETALGNTPKYVVVLNNDTIPTPGMAEQLVETLTRRPEVKMVSTASNSLYDMFTHRPGFEEGPEDTLLERVWRFAWRRTVDFAGVETVSPFVGFTCAAFDWTTWQETVDGALALDHVYPYDLHMAAAFRNAGHTIAVREDAVIYHMGHATYTEIGETAAYERDFGPMLHYQDAWGHLPDHYELLHELYYITSRRQA